MTRDAANKVEKLSALLDAAIQGRISDLNKHRRMYRWMYISFAICVPGLSAVNAAVIGWAALGNDPNQYGAKVAVAITLLITLIGIIDVAIRPREKYIINERALTEVHYIRQKVNFHKIVSETDIKQMNSLYEAFINNDRDLFKTLADLATEVPENSPEKAS